VIQIVNLYESYTDCQSVYLLVGIILKSVRCKENVHGVKRKSIILIFDPFTCNLSPKQKKFTKINSKFKIKNIYKNWYQLSWILSSPIS